MPCCSFVRVRCRTARDSCAALHCVCCAAPHCMRGVVQPCPVCYAQHRSVLHCTLLCVLCCTALCWELPGTMHAMLFCTVCVAPHLTCVLRRPARCVLCCARALYAAHCIVLRIAVHCLCGATLHCAVHCTTLCLLCRSALCYAVHYIVCGVLPCTVCAAVHRAVSCSTLHFACCAPPLSAAHRSALCVPRCNVCACGAALFFVWGAALHMCAVPLCTVWAGLCLSTVCVLCRIAVCVLRRTARGYPGAPEKPSPPPLAKGRTPRLWPVCAHWGDREDTWQATRPRCGRSAHAGARGRTQGRQYTPAMAAPRTRGREGGRWLGCTPRSWRGSARWGVREDTC